MRISAKPIRPSSDTRPVVNASVTATTCSTLRQSRKRRLDAAPGASWGGDQMPSSVTSMPYASAHWTISDWRLEFQ